jgi:hypothetical protein
MTQSWLACILFAMLTAKMPFCMSNVAEKFKKQILRQIIFPHHPELYIKPSAKILIW